MSQRSSPRAERETADLLRSLADHLRVIPSARAATFEWLGHWPDGLRPHAERARRRLDLGQGLAEVVNDLEAILGEPARDLSDLLDLHRRAGGNLAVAVDRLAERAAARAEARAAAHAATSGMLLSGRLVAALPLFALLLIPAARAELFDPIGLLIAVLGVVLSLLGYRWMIRMIPAAPSHSSSEVVADLAADLAAAGAPLRTAFELATARMIDCDPQLARCRRVASLGLDWGGALVLHPAPSMKDLGELVATAQRTGAPIVVSLRRFAEASRNQARLEFESRQRQAPVKMVVPLVSCVLPAFLLLAVVPLIRAFLH